MATGRRRQAWNHTSALMAMMINSNPFRGDNPPVQPREFNPYAAPTAPEPPPPKAPFSFLTASLGGPLD